ncbi:EAL domain-containing protein [Undibacterium fentianense]|uniref:EAL domain-containing protein n=1 Tax=Undibacterium fentianense TaxID=2828728 RepID=A0A941E6J3_9BURK|nr:EAL domain-containing protein [Undibacterium fentianense]MBR7801464.1 EAL domain-containing protein [Undibacterium fentianense]
MTEQLSAGLNSELEIHTLRERNSLLNILSEFAIALLRLRSREEVLWYTANEVVGQMGFDDCVIYLWDEASQLLIQQSAFGHKISEQGSVNNALTLRLGEGLVGRAAKSREIVLVNDLSTDPNYVMDMQQASSELAIPIIYADQLIGVIDSENLAKNFYTPEHIKILNAVASMVSAKLAQANLIHQLETSISELEYARKLQSILFNIAALTYEDENFFKVYEKIHHLITELLVAKSFFVAVYNEDAGCIEFPYFVDERHPDMSAEDGPIDAEMRGMSAWVIFNNSPLLLGRNEIIQRAQNGDFEILGTVAESWLGVPIDAGDHLKGALVVQTYSSLVSYLDSDRELLGYVAQHVSNLLKRKFAEKKLQHLALHDALTGLANRSLFLDRVSHALKKRERIDQRLCAVLYMDVDLFKTVNDRYGHAVGDALLVAFAKLLTLQTRQLDTVARLGGDEFALFLEDIDSEATAVCLAERIIQALREPILANDVSIACSTSIGIAFITDATVSADEIIRRADTAMYQAKAAGRGHFQLFDPLSDRANVRDLLFGEEILRALNEQHFVLHYQPVIHVQSKRAVGFEALIRWPHQERGWIAPNEFIDFAEKHRLIEKIDRFVLRQVVQQMQEWRLEFGLTPKVSINISGRHFASPEFIAMMLALLEEFVIPPHSLGIEITERAVIDKFAQAQANIQVLRDHHVRILLDDFGTGYSSLNYLHQLTLDVLKIDRTFVQGISVGKVGNPIIHSIVALASALNLTVVAEGVETEDELRALQDVQCELCQGFYFAKALPARDAIQYFLDHQ